MQHGISHVYLAVKEYFNTFVLYTNFGLIYRYSNSPLHDIYHDGKKQNSVNTKVNQKHSKISKNILLDKSVLLEGFSLQEGVSQQGGKGFKVVIICAFRG